LSKPVQFGKYYLLDRINVGGMAEVFKAKAFGVEGFERLVAVKRILPNIAEDEEFITMFIDEAKIAVQLQHANIAQIFDLGKVDDAFFIALEYVHGKDLRAIFDRLQKSESSMPMPQACFIIMQLCEGLDYAHNKRDAQGRELNLVHRDVSPQNMLIGYDGEIKLVDFGIAKAAGKASKTQAGILKGKFGYMSPEQVRGLPVDRRSDIFSLGIVIYELLTGERLFVGESDFSTLEKVRNVEILPPSSFNKKISAELERISLKALAKDVEDRYQNAIDLHDDLQAFLYSVGEFYSRKDLAAWMKKTFAEELAQENAQLEEYQQYDHRDDPTPAPPKSAPRLAPVASADSGAAVAADELEWDEEELETQIFDKGMDDPAAAKPERLVAQDLLQDEDGDEDRVPEVHRDQQAVAGADIFSLGDDNTVIGGPSPEMFADLGLPPPEPARPSSAGGQQRAITPSGRPLGGPPPGISAFRQGGHPTDPYGVPRSAYEPSSGGRPTSSHEMQGPPKRQTLTGLPPTGLAPPLSAPSDRRPLEHFARPRPRAPWTVLVVAVCLVGAVLGYRYLARPGRLQISVKPSDAQISIEGSPVRGTPPLIVERSPGPYHLSVEREGYVRRDQNVEILAGQRESIEVELEPSPDTGFELVSEPQGELVWLDGQPVTNGEENAQQSRTNFKAYRVAPGRHVIEIKGDPRFADWKQEFFQEPGKTLKLKAELRPRSATAMAAPPSLPARPAAVVPTPTRAPAPTPPPRVASPAPVPAAPRPAVASAVPSGPNPAPPPAAAPSAASPAPVAASKPEADRPARPARPVPSSPPRRFRAAASRVASAAPTRSGQDVFEQEAKPAAAASGDDCSVTLGSKPWSEVWLDGKNTGKLTPVVDFKIACGKHTITLRNPEIPIEKTETISLRAGDRYKKVIRLVDTGQ
jgi:eukaryotic-like serine/threonine-protein kinase